MGFLTDLAGAFGSLFGGDSDEEKMASQLWENYKATSPPARRTTNQLQDLQGKIDFETGKVMRDAYLPAALRNSVLALRSMTQMEEAGGLDELTQTGIASLDQLYQKLADRGEITGGQQYQAEQQIADRLREAQLKTRRAAASTAAGYEADVWRNFYSMAVNAAGQTLWSQSMPKQTPGWQRGAAQGEMIGRTTEGLAGAIASLFGGGAGGLGIGG